MSDKAPRIVDGGLFMLRDFLFRSLLRDLWGDGVTNERTAAVDFFVLRQKDVQGGVAVAFLTVENLTDERRSYGISVVLEDGSRKDVMPLTEEVGTGSSSANEEQVTEAEVLARFDELR